VILPYIRDFRDFSKNLLSLSAACGVLVSFGFLLLANVASVNGTWLPPEISHLAPIIALGGGPSVKKNNFLVG